MTGTEAWTHGDPYERYVGRWSRPIARQFLAWLEAPRGLEWLDVGCGTGALTGAVLAHDAPRRIVGLDPSAGYLDLARQRLTAENATFREADAQELPFANESFDRVVSGLMLNFVPDPGKALGEMARVTRRGGEVALYVWDYAGRMDMMRRFWDAAAATDPQAAALDEGRRFPLCQPDALRALFEATGNLRDMVTRPIDTPTVFSDFDDFWTPFLGGQGPAPGYCMSLSESDRTALRERLRRSLPVHPDGSIEMIGRAWAIRGSKA